MPPNALLLSVQTNHRRTRSSSQDGSEAGSGRVASPRLMTPPLCTPPLQMGGQAGFNPHSRLLRRSSSCSTLGSIVDSDDGRAGEDRPLATEAEAEAEWTRTDIERLKSVYDECVQEASAFDTPFTGLPPSQLLQNIAHACRRVYRAEWTHSIPHTRAKALSLARQDQEEEEKEQQAREAPRAMDESGDVDMQATPRPELSGMTPKRRKVRRNDSMDFLPCSRDLANVERLCNKLHRTSDATIPYSIVPSSASKAISAGVYADISASAPFSGPGRLSRAMTFSSSSTMDDFEGHRHASRSPERTSGLHLRMDESDIVRPPLRSASTPHAAMYPTTPAPRPALGASYSFAAATEATRLADTLAASGGLMAPLSHASYTSCSRSYSSSAHSEDETASTSSYFSRDAWARAPSMASTSGNTTPSPKKKRPFDDLEVDNDAQRRAATFGRALNFQHAGTNSDVTGSEAGTSSYFASSVRTGRTSSAGTGITDGLADPFVAHRDPLPPSQGPASPSARSPTAAWRLSGSWIALPGKAQPAPEQMTLDSPFDLTFGSRRA